MSLMKELLMSINDLSNYIQKEYKIFFLDVFAENIDNSEIDLEGAFFNSQMIALSKLTDMEFTRIKDLSVRSILAEALPKSISFKPLDYSSWADDVASFCSLNQSHKSFSEILAVDKNYNVILNSITEISNSSSAIIEIILRDAEVNLTKRFYSEVSDEMYMAMKNMTEEAHVPALRLLSDLLLRRDAEIGLIPTPPPRVKLLKTAIEKSRSYNDKIGTIRFGVSNGVLEIQSDQGSQLIASNSYLGIMKRALNMISNQDVLRRIDNKNKIIANLIREYYEVFQEEHSNENHLIMYTIGDDVSKQLSYNSSRDEGEKIEGDLLGFLQSFEVANAAYVHNTPAVRALMSDLDRAKRSYALLGENNSHEEWAVLISMKSSNGIFSDKARDTISKLSKILNERQDDVSAGLTTMGLGTIRGSLQAMAGALLDGAFSEARYSAKQAASESYRRTLNFNIENNHLQQMIVAFVSGHESEIMWLYAHMPIYFSWVKSFVDIIKYT